MPGFQTQRPRLKSIATVSLSGDLREKLIAAAAVGFDAVEIFENDLLAFEGSPADVKRMAKDLGLTISLFQPFRDFEAMPVAQRAVNLDRAERKFDVMQELGAKLLLVCSNTQAAAINDDARTAADLFEMAERAASRGLRVGYEALSWGRHVTRWRHAWNIVRRADHPALGLVLDSFHTLCVGDRFDAGHDAPPGEKIFFVQLADAPRLTMDPLSWSRHFRVFPGQGQLPVADFLHEALAAGYRGPLSLEIFNDSFRAAPPVAIAQDGLRSLTLLEDQARIDLCGALPPIAPSEGVAYIEFALDENAHCAFANRLASLGFAQTGRHRTLTIDRYEQGGVTFLLNSDLCGGAAGHFRLHGPSIYAIGFRVGDVNAAAARAQAFRCLALPCDDGLRDVTARVVSTPDRSLAHMVDAEGLALLHARFESEGDRGVADNGALSGVDHVAQAVPHLQMDGAALFYAAVFGFTAEPMCELADPHGMVSSRAMVSPDRSISLPMNASQCRNTMTARRIARHDGPAVHHVACATDDIFAAARRMKARGGHALAIPSNYYEDLSCRLTLNLDLIERLKDHNILYDEDEHGAFMHFYTPASTDGFFFEVVERRGYRGFGAANASIRLACQARQYDLERLLESV